MTDYDIARLAERCAEMIDCKACFSADATYEELVADIDDAIRAALNRERETPA